MKEDSDSDLSEQINDQLSQLWTNAKNKRKELLSHLTPYSKRVKQSLNSSLQPPLHNQRQPAVSHSLQEKRKSPEGLQKQIVRLRGQLEEEVVQGKHKELELDRLKKTAEKLAMEKKYLVKELQQTHLPDQNCSKVLNESSILPRAGKSASNKKQKPSKPKPAKAIAQNTTVQQLQDLSRERLIELVRSTSEYRSYVFYYDSNELSYLRRLNQQHKKNCEHTPGQKEKQFWAPSQLVQGLKMLSIKEELDLSERQIETIIARMKGTFENCSSQRLSKLKDSLDRKVQTAERATKNSIPYELVQVAKARERELSRYSTNKSYRIFK